MAKKDLTLPIFSGKSDSEKSVTLPASIFGVKVSPKLITQYVYTYLNNLKKGKGKVKTRSEVTGSTRKIYRQKGTGRARHGDIKAPIFVGGGVALGPTGDYRKLKLTKKMRQKALFATLTDKLEAKKIKVVADSLLSKIKKTKEASALITKVIDKSKGESFLVLPHSDKSRLFFQNVDEAYMNEVSALNAYRVLKAKEVIFTEKSLTEFVNLFKKNE